MRLLDLYCKAGGCSVGYARAGFEVEGVDIEPQPNYPFPFHLGDALTFLAEHGQEFDVIAASPPCQSSSALTKGTNKGRVYEDWIPQTREALEATGKPWVMENVQGSSLRRRLVLCGEMFNLGVIRHRYFESNVPLAQPAHRAHRGRVQGNRHGRSYVGPYVAPYGAGGGKGSVEEWQRALGIDWTSDRGELANAIPPAYTQFIGSQIQRRSSRWNSRSRSFSPGTSSQDAIASPVR
jgi:hypothetical protein